MNENIFSSMDFGPLKEFLESDDVTDVSYSNNGQLWLRTLSKGIYRVERPDINNALMEKLAFQCANAMGTTFNMAHPFLDAESAELRLNFVHNSIARNGIAVVLRKTPAKIRLEKSKIIADRYITEDIHNFLIECVHGHCNIIVSGETGSGKTELVKYLAAQTKEDEKLITIEDTLELHLDRIFPHRDIVAMKTNNIASYSEVLVTCMRQNPKWILLSEVRSAEAVTAVRNSISSGHNILSTIHADKAASIPNRLYSLLESNIEIDQFLRSICRYVQLGVHVRGYQDPRTKAFRREVCEVTEFYVDEDNEAGSNTIFLKTRDGKIYRKNPTKYLLDYLSIQGVELTMPKVDEKGIEYQETQPVDANKPENTQAGGPQPSSAMSSNSQAVGSGPQPNPASTIPVGGQMTQPTPQPQMSSSATVHQPEVQTVSRPTPNVTTTFDPLKRAVPPQVMPASTSVQPTGSQPVSGSSTMNQQPIYPGNSNPVQ